MLLVRCDTGRTSWPFVGSLINWAVPFQFTQNESKSNMYTYIIYMRNWHLCIQYVYNMFYISLLVCCSYVWALALLGSVGVKFSGMTMYSAGSSCCYLVFFLCYQWKWKLDGKKNMRNWHLYFLQYKHICNIYLYRIEKFEDV